MEVIAMFFLFKRHQTSPMQCFRRETEELGDLGMLPTLKPATVEIDEKSV